MIATAYIAKKKAERASKGGQAPSKRSRSRRATPTLERVASNTKKANSFLSFLSDSDIRAEIASYLDTKDFLSLANTTFGLRQSLRTERWDINRRLARFVDDPIELRNLQARTSALISGPFALAFAEGKMWSNSYPVIWVRKEHRNEWLDYLAAQGYYQQAAPSVINQFQPEYSDATDSSFNGSCERPGYGIVEIHAHFTDFNAFAAMVWMTELTSLCNFITWEKAYVMFAKATLHAHKTFPVNTHRIEELGAVLTFQETIGWPVYDFVPRWYRYPLGEKALGGPNRSPGDRSSWIMPLDTVGIKPGTLNYENCDFGITTQNKQRIVLFTAYIYHPLLKHDYASSYRGGAYLGKLALIREIRLDSILPYELLKHGQAACPPGVPYPHVDATLHDAMMPLDERWEPTPGWTPPPNWKYVDDCLAEWIGAARAASGRPGLEYWSEGHDIGPMTQ